MRLEQQENVSVTGEVEGRRGRGRPRVNLVDSLAKVFDGAFMRVRLLQMTGSRSDCDPWWPTSSRIRHFGKVRVNGMMWIVG